MENMGNYKLIQIQLLLKLNQTTIMGVKEVDGFKYNSC